jgi:hypothetical protein
VLRDKNGQGEKKNKRKSIRVLAKRCSPHTCFLLCGGAEAPFGALDNVVHLSSQT